MFRGAVPASAEEQVPAEEVLLKRACSGDEAAFNEIYGKYAPLVHGVLLARVPYDDVGDLVQEVFLAAYKNLAAVRESRALGAWLVAIARNRAAEHFRHTKRSDELPEDVRGRDERKAEAIEVLTAIRGLPDAYRETLILRLVEGMTGNEIAARTGLKPESVRVNLHRGMDLLRKRLGISGVGR